MLFRSSAEAAMGAAGRFGRVTAAVTEGGEALPGDGVMRPEPRWRVLWTHSHSEQLVHDQLAGRQFRPFLPTIGVWSRRGGVRHPIRVPMFPGYLFLHDAMGKPTYLEVRKTRGLVAILGERWDRLAEVPDCEIESIQALCRSNLPVLPHAYLQEGRRVRVTRGPLAGVEGILVRSRPDRGLLVLSVELLQRSVAVELDCTSVAQA
jgi:transcriptional antiterminator NusG